MSLQKWTLLSSKDVSPNKWFPIESRTYKLPNGQIVEDFTVAKLGNAAMIIPITTNGKVVLIRQFKPGADEVVMQFPAGRIEETHNGIDETALHELEEETGIKIDKTQLHQFPKMIVASSKNTESVFFFLAENCEFNSQQKLDENEEIEIFKLSFSEIDSKILNREIWCVQTAAAWLLAKQKFPEKFSTLK
jgi:8-oxo-dGTP pyrophosphatase MutT (NUDIX family)